MNNIPPAFMPPGQPPPSRNWWQRNWMWFVPTGCVSLLALPVAFVVGIMMVVFSALKSTDAYKTAVQRAETSEPVANALGTPISEGIFLSGHVNVSGPSGNADLSIPISGPKGKGTIYVTATKSEDVWVYSKLGVRVDSTGDTIDLRPPAP